MAEPKTTRPDRNPDLVAITVVGALAAVAVMLLLEHPQSQPVLIGFVVVYALALAVIIRWAVRRRG